MRSKGGLDSDYLDSGDWKDQNTRGDEERIFELDWENGERKIKMNSFSGNERNKLFLNSMGTQFDDVSLWSGTDSIADGRCFSIWDYDHDGAQDIALINGNEPHLQIFRNQLSETREKANAFVAVRLAGGNDQSKPSSQFSNRNGIGAIVTVASDGKTFLREQRCGEGFSGQNSATMVIGFGPQKAADSISVRWPSGMTQQASDIPAGSLITFYENTRQSPKNAPFILTTYEPAQSGSNQPAQVAKGPFDFPISSWTGDEAGLRVLITMATWCSSCKKHLAPLADLKDALADSSVSFFGIPVDKSDTPEKLKAYAKEHKVPYRILHELEASERNMATRYLRGVLGSEATPCTIITDKTGNPLHIQFGIPTVSEIRRLLALSS